MLAAGPMMQQHPTTSLTMQLQRHRTAAREMSQLLALQRSAWQRGSRLPCADILTSPDFLELFMDVCGVEACTAWRDAVDLRN